MPPDSPVARVKIRMIEQFADEAILVGNLPPIWMPYWSEPDKRDKERMEKGREGLRNRDFPYIEQLLGEAPPGGYICGAFSMADVPMMVLAMVLEVDAMPLAKFSRFERYLKHLRERPSYRAISARTKVAEAISLSNQA
jgi:hypothetical protein